MESLLVHLALGFAIGLVAKMLAPGGGPTGLLITSLLGIAGSVVAAFLGHALGIYAPGQPAGFVGSVVGAVLLLVGYHRLLGRGKRRV